MSGSDVTIPQDKTANQQSSSSGNSGSPLVENPGDKDIGEGKVKTGLFVCLFVCLLFFLFAVFSVLLDLLL